MDDTLEFNFAANDGGLSSGSLCSPSPLSLYSDLLVVFGNSKGYLRKITNVLTIWILDPSVISKYLKRETFLPQTNSQERNQSFAKCSTKTEFCNDLMIR